MPDCGAEHPEMAGVLCRKSIPCWGTHLDHRAHEVWPGNGERPARDTLLPPAERVRLISTIKPEIKTGPPTSHEAYESYRPILGPARERVLSYLHSHEGQWVDAVALTAPEVGGFAGTRRLRELRALGYAIETRQDPERHNVWQHRLVSPVPTK